MSHARVQQLLRQLYSRTAVTLAPPAACSRYQQRHYSSNEQQFASSSPAASEQQLESEHLLSQDPFIVRDLPDFDQMKQDMVKFLERVKDPTKLDTKYVPLRSKKKTGEGYTVDHFVDHVLVEAQGGSGGDGSASLASESGKEFAGPDGGDGGNGGHVVFKAVKGRSSLCHVSYKLRGKDGEPGRNKLMHGKNAPHSVVQVPLGTLFKHDGKFVGSLDVEEALYVAARGGAGGKGNKYFTTDADQAPTVAEYGAKGEKFEYEVELRTMADIGLIGFPNAGKSTLLRAISRARPKVASYPFTTLNPHVGVVTFVDHEQLSVADIPGLIEDAHLNKGLGHSFLRHIQRCSGLLYVIDAAQPEPWKQLDVLRKELDMYAENLSCRPHAVVANKIDLPEAKDNLEELVRRVQLPVVSISAKYGESVRELLSVLRWLKERYGRSATSALDSQWHGTAG